jgi:protein translocase SecG subunit
MFEIAEIAVSLILIALILMQERGGGAGGLFGGGGDTAYQTRRGAERAIYWATIVAAIVFVSLALIKLSGI